MENLQEIPAPLLEWYDRHARILPWREQPTPYRVWVSEIMLQQTRVEAVKPYFERFIGELPTIRDLAEAPEDRLLKLWEGLGYYNRVRNMQKAARQLVNGYGGEMPQDFDAILALPGIGSYTAGAIASIAFGMRRPAVDGNVLRVLSRLEKSYDDILKQSVRRRFEKELLQVIPEERAGDFNQSLIELGAIVCVPNGAPKCPECPLKELCRAHADGVELELPKKSLLAGLYELPNLPGRLNREEVLEFVKKQGLSPLRIQKLPAAKHIFSHIEWHMTGYAVKVEEPPAFWDNGGTEPEEQDIRKASAWEGIFFVEKEQMEEKFSIPAAFGAYTQYFKERY